MKKKYRHIFELNKNIADAILAIHSVIKILETSKVDERVIHLLIKDRTKVPLGTIEKVFKALKELPEVYLIKDE